MERKLKSSDLKTEALIWIILGPFILLTIFFFGLGIILLAPVGLVYGTFSLIFLIRTGKIAYLVKVLNFYLLSYICIAIVFLGINMREPIMITLITIFILLSIWTIILTILREFHWRSQDILELAASPVNEVKNGFTKRPYPAGKAGHDWNTIKKFARFIRSNLIAIPVFEKDKVFIFLNMPKSKILSYNSDYSDNSWVAFGADGLVTVHITDLDYNQYREAFAFDQICQSLGSLFIEFLDAYAKGDEKHIFYRLNSVSSGLF
ncbi:MAG: hypothetical protein KKA81_15255 [Bacteroidetes bacterium]|nr:hypothetical protein [Bacteroidota bacterium]